MGSLRNPNPWAPYDDYKDCSAGICSMNCPQWCYFIFPPPPPEDNSGKGLSPLFIALIGILASAFLLVSYYAIVSKYCRRRRRDHNPSTELEENHNQTNHEPWQVASTGLDEALIKSITVCKFKKGDGLVEGTDCSVCLNEFQEAESLRLLPKCNHAFHLACIDTWLKSHSNCPLCRSNIAALNPSPLPLPAQGAHNPSDLQISSLQIQRGNDAILVIDDLERCRREEVVVSFTAETVPKTPFEAPRDEENKEQSDDIIEITQLEGVLKLRRSISLGSSSCYGRVSIADILRDSEDDDNFQMRNRRFSVGNGSSTQLEEDGNPNNGSSMLHLAWSPFAIKRSISTGRFMLGRHGKGENSNIPN